MNGRYGNHTKVLGQGVPAGRHALSGLFDSRVGHLIDRQAWWHRLGLTDAHALRRQDVWPGALHSETP